MADPNSRKKRLEEAEKYFNDKNVEALKRLRAREENKPRLSPITGEPMEQLTIMGVVVDRCPTSHGIWLDAGEFEEILDVAKQEYMEAGDSMLSKFFATIFDK